MSIKHIVQCVDSRAMCGEDTTPENSLQVCNFIDDLKALRGASAMNKYKAGCCSRCLGWLRFLFRLKHGVGTNR